MEANDVQRRAIRVRANAYLAVTLATILAATPIAAAAAGLQRASSGEDRKTLEGRYADALQSSVMRHWVPTDSDRGHCRVYIKQALGGEVLSVHADPGCTFTSERLEAARKAVFDASPLPYRGFESIFRADLTYTFKGWR
jgi:colicin import membrane protein